LSSYTAGQIVIADWRDALPKEPNKLRPAIVVENDQLFDPDYAKVIVVPLSEDRGLAVPELSLPIDPTPENGCTKPCFALSYRHPRQNRVSIFYAEDMSLIILILI